MKLNAAIRSATRMGLLSGILILSGCVAATVSLVTVTTVSIAKDPRTFGTFVDDNVIEINVLKDMISDPLLDGTHVSTTVMNTVALLTGEVNSVDQKLRAAAIANAYQGVSQVINQIDITEESSLASRSNDSLITAKVKTALIKSKSVPSNSIKVVTERGVVYLMGLVSRAVSVEAVALTQQVSGVERIVKVFYYTD